MQKSAAKPVTKKVSVIIFNYNGMGFVDKCVENILSQDYQDFDLFMLDNGSTDGSDTYIMSRYPRVKIIKIANNCGIAKASDVAFSQMKTPYIISVHNDVFLRQGWIREMVRALDKAPENTGAIEGEILQEGKPLSAGEVNIFLTSHKGDFPTEVLYPATGNMIFKNVRSNYIDHDYFFYYDDLYFGLMLRFSGYNILKNRNAISDTQGTRSETTMEIKKRNQFYSERNRHLVFLTFFSRGTIAKLLPWYWLYAITNIGILKTQNRWKLVPWLKAYFWILTHTGTILKKRKYVQSQKRIDDSEILKYLTGGTRFGKLTWYRKALGL